MTTGGRFTRRAGDLCTGVAAVFCPRCGTCTCQRDEAGGFTDEPDGLPMSGVNHGQPMRAVHDPACPLHGPGTPHPIH